MRSVCLMAVVVAAAINTGCALHGEPAVNAVPFVGEWMYHDSTGSVPPYDLVVRVEFVDGRLIFNSKWAGSQSAPQGLTLIGVVTPRIALDPSGRENGSQVGPFVFRHTSHWRNDELVTVWSTSEYMGSSYSGTWKRAVSKDRAEMTLDIDALSSTGAVSRARVVFHRH